MKKEVTNEQTFTKNGMFLGFFSYLAVVCLIAWVFI
jgi:hypothetical protein